MAKRRRRMFSAAESAEVWDRWQRGEGLKLIGRVFGEDIISDLRASEAAWRHSPGTAATIAASAEHG